MKKIAVIGAGASGTVASIFAKNENTTVDLYEKNDDVLKKVLATGNGRCNYFNENFLLDYFYSSNKELLNDIITLENKEKILSFFSSIGIIPNIKKGYYYPSSNKSSSIKEALKKETILKGVNILTNQNVLKIEKKDNCFIITTNEYQKKYDKVIIATGSKAYVKEENSYKLIQSLGHELTNITPALVPLQAKGDFFKKWDGVRCDAKVSLFENDKLIKEEIGELQLTDYGISGICVFNLSGLANKMLYERKKPIIKINFLNFIKEENYLNWLEQRSNNLLNRNLKELLITILNEKLVDTILYMSNIKENKSFNDLTKEEKEKLIENLTCFKLEITSSKDYLRAQVCQGGVNLKQINTSTMESNIIKDLYITGELLDVYGICGGYNLGFAFITGYLAGKSAGVKND